MSLDIVLRPPSGFDIVLGSTIYLTSTGDFHAPEFIETGTTPMNIVGFSSLESFEFVEGNLSGTTKMTLGSSTLRMTVDGELIED